MCVSSILGSTAVLLMPLFARYADALSLPHPDLPPAAAATFGLATGTPPLRIDYLFSARNFCAA